MRINILIILTDFQPMFLGGIEVEHWMKISETASKCRHANSSYS